MRNKFAVLISFLLLFVFSAMAQPPPHPPRGEKHRDRHTDWFDHIDTNKNGIVERGEFDADIDSMFKNLDTNGDGVIDETERPQPPPRREDAPHSNGERFADAPEHPRMPPPFLMDNDDRDGKLTRAEFDENARRHFSAMDKNGDGVISRDEADAMNDDGFRPPPPPDNFASPPAPTVEFLGAEMRFGDKLVKNAPFSAETVMENTRRLFDGSTVSTQNKGAIYRDGAGRTRREQSLETVGGFSLGNQAQKLIFITDANDGTQYFLDPNRKTARKISLQGNRPPPPQPPDARLEKARTESLGTKILEGVSVEGTRETGEIPAGRIGNDKSLQIVTERWFSSELQIIVMSRHIDPLAGEQIFRLTNIRRAEPARELFNVPQDYKLEGDRNRHGEDKRP